MKKPAIEGRANSLRNDILPQLCLLADSAQALWMLDLLGKNESTARIRAIGFKGSKLPVIKGNFAELPIFTQWNASKRGIYLVIGNGHDTDDSIYNCPAFFVEWDDLSVEIQIQQWQVLKLPKPTFQLKTSGKSVHSYWVTNEPVAKEKWQPIQTRLIDYCKADKNNKNPSRVMRLAGFYYVNKLGEITNKSKIINVSNRRYSLAEFVGYLPEPVKPTPKPIAKTIAPELTTNRTLIDIEKALNCIPQRVEGSNTYDKYRNIAWGLKKAVVAVGHSEETALTLLENHSPSSSCGWNIPQILRSGGESIGEGTFWYWAMEAGYKPKTNKPSKDFCSTLKGFYE